MRGLVIAILMATGCGAQPIEGARVIVPRLHACQWSLNGIEGFTDQTDQNLPGWDLCAAPTEREKGLDVRAPSGMRIATVVGENPIFQEAILDWSTPGTDPAAPPTCDTWNGEQSLSFDAYRWTYRVDADCADGSLSLHGFVIGSTRF